MTNLTEIQTAVINQLGYKELDTECKQILNDVLKGGADGGFGGFIYYNETVKFFDDNKDSIMEMAQNMAESLGEDTMTMISNFNCIKDLGLKPTDIAKIVYSNEEHEDSTQVKNALAWYALEETAQVLEQ